MSESTKRIILVGIILAVYGYLCRILGLNFFWESKYIGWIIIIIGAISFLFNRVKSKKTEGKKTLLEKIGICILIFVLLVQAILAIVIPNTDAYKVAKDYLINNEGLKSEIGNLKSFSLVPLGSIQKSTSDNVESGTATILFIGKGEKKFRDITVYVEKKAGTDWVVVGIK